MTGLPPGRRELREVFDLKYGPSERWGWGPRMRARFGYFTPDEHYEALLARLVGTETAWLDAGCGRHLLPANEPLARRLASTCRLLVGVDPDPAVLENPYLHERRQEELASFSAAQRFDLVTLRMVAEHLVEPAAAVRKLADLLAPEGRVVIYTVYRWSPVSILAKLIPHPLHHPLKRLLWRSAAEDTFPVAYRLNTRRKLRETLARDGLVEEHFAYLDDCRTFARFRLTHFVELAAWRALASVGLRYPELCLLGVYRRR